jgi:hypothetical protein
MAKSIIEPSPRPLFVKLRPPAIGGMTGSRRAYQGEPPPRQAHIVLGVTTNKVHGTPYVWDKPFIFLNSYVMYFVC